MRILDDFHWNFSHLVFFLSDSLWICAYCRHSFIQNNNTKFIRKKLNMNKFPKIIAFKPHLNIWMGELNLNRFSVWWKKRAWYLLLCSRMYSLKNRKQFLLEMSESIHKPLHSFRHKYLSLKILLFFLHFLMLSNINRSRIWRILMLVWSLWLN